MKARVEKPGCYAHFEMPPNRVQSLSLLTVKLYLCLSRRRLWQSLVMR